MVSRSFIIGLIAACSFAAAVAAAFYVKKFSGFPLSCDPAHWGQFGDYLGGVLNPLIGLSTLIATCVIAMSVQRLTQLQLDQQQSSSDLQIRTQKTLLLTQFRYELILKFQHQADAIFLKLDNVVLLEKEKISPDVFHDLNDELKRLLDQIESIDQSLLIIDNKVRKSILDAIEAVGEFDISQWWNKDSKSNYLGIKHDVEIVIRSLLSQVLSL